jgi:ubiquinone/menaquinone biosynthesis C-methylase UbiE
VDELASYNQARWDEIARADSEYTRPFLELTPERARRWLDPHAVLGDLTGKEVLCLGGGGGQQSVAFALLGARVTVLDLSETQLARDRQAAAHYGLPVTLAQGDMRDLGGFPGDGFDIVYQPYSINFVPDVRPVIRAVARVLRQRGLYRLDCANPFTMSIDEAAWDGRAYPLKDPYVGGAEVSQHFPHWDVHAADGTVRQVSSPKEFRHTLSALTNTLVASGFVILGFWEETSQIADPEPGTWEHFKSVAAPYFTFWSILRPDALMRGETDATGRA